MINPPLLYMPPAPGNLVAMENYEYIPWSGRDSEDVFSVYTLGQKLRAKKPVNGWLARLGIFLLRLPSGDTYRLITPEWRRASGKSAWTLDDEALYVKD